jgi:hypothetical protein
MRFDSVRWGSLGVRGAMTYAAATSRNVLLEESLCIFWIALLPCTPPIYPRIDGGSTGRFRHGLISLEVRLAVGSS